MNLAVSANQLADWAFQHCKVHAPIAGCANLGAFREWLCNRCSDFRYVWNIADGHKHMVLRDPMRSRPVKAVEGAFDLGIFDQMAFDTSRLVVEFEDGKARGLPEIFRSVTEMWAGLLKEWAL
jgi:hypothetical protein